MEILCIDEEIAADVRMMEAQCFSLHMVLTIGDSDQLIVSAKYRCGSHAISLPPSWVEDVREALEIVQYDLIIYQLLFSFNSPWRYE